MSPADGAGEGGVPACVDHPELKPAWEQIGRRFEQAGLVPVGRVRVGATTREQRHALGALLGRVITREAVMIDLAALDRRLHERSGIGGLQPVLVAVRTQPLRDRPGDRAARALARELAAELLDVPAATTWAAEWVAWLRRLGLLTGRPDAEQLVRDAVRVLLELVGDDRLTSSTARGDATRSRVEIAARLLGDAHALDVDRILHRMVLHGLALATASPPLEGRTGVRRCWQGSGSHPT